MRVARLNGDVLDAESVERERLATALGPGLIETMRAHGGSICARALHMQRLAASIADLGWSGAPDAARIASELDAIVAAGGAPDLAVRLVISDDGAILAEAWPVDPLSGDPAIASAITCRGLWDPGAAVVEHKLTDRGHWDRAEALAAGAGADVAIATDAAGRLGEASRAAVFAVMGGRVATAPVAGLLPGIGRRLVCELLGDVAELALPEDRWRGADELFTVSALRGVTAIVSVDGVTVGNGIPGPVTCRVADAVRAELLGGTPV
jgi:branched-subunit amino acid aminotransferase/4-amino-4-deoxychorismate lyase